MRSLDPDDPAMVSHTVIKATVVGETILRFSGSSSSLSGLVFDGERALREDDAQPCLTLSKGHPVLSRCTIRDCADTATTVEGARARMDRCTFAGNNRAVLLSNNGSADFFRCDISDNWGTQAALSLSGSTVIDACRIERNQNSVSLLIHAWDADNSMLVRNSLFMHNTSNSGTINILHFAAPVTIQGCTVVENTANGYGAMQVVGHADVMNSIFWNNGDRPIRLGPLVGHGGMLTIRNCILQHGLVGISLTSHLTHLVYDSNYSSDPELEPDGFHLTDSSIAINAGIELPLWRRERDLDGGPRVVDDTIDIGCDERD